MNEALLNVLVVISLLVGAAGIIVPILPGTVLVVIVLFVWTLVVGGPVAWSAFAIMMLILGLGQVLKYLIPGRSMTAAGVPGRSIIVGGISAIVGFFAIPIVGLPLGFIAGVYLAEQARLRNWAAARTSTWAAMRATGFSILIELAALMMAGSVWAAAAVAVA